MCLCIPTALHRINVTTLTRLTHLQWSLDISRHQYPCLILADIQDAGRTNLMNADDNLYGAWALMPGRASPHRCADAGTTDDATAGFAAAQGAGEKTRAHVAARGNAGERRWLPTPPPLPQAHPHRHTTPHTRPGPADWLAQAPPQPLGLTGMPVDGTRYGNSTMCSVHSKLSGALARSPDADLMNGYAGGAAWLFALANTNANYSPTPLLYSDLPTCWISPNVVIITLKKKAHACALRAAAAALPYSADMDHDLVPSGA